MKQVDPHTFRERMVNAFNELENEPKPLQCKVCQSNVW